jgi:hypothetical protein
MKRNFKNTWADNTGMDTAKADDTAILGLLTSPRIADG